MEFDLVEQTSGIVHSGRIMSVNASAEALQHFDERNGRRVAHVVGVGFESQAKNRNRPALDTATECFHYLEGHTSFACFINCDRFFNQTQGNAVILGRTQQCKRVLGKTGSAITGTSIEKTAPDTLVEPYTDCKFSNVAANLLAQVCKFIDEGDLGGKKCICCVFDQF